nr:VIT1/CCC1 transporter family protein [Arsukibacterium sp.]
MRAACLGANDGIVSTASLIIGVAAANTNHQSVMLAGVAGLVAGAMSVAAGEYVSSVRRRTLNMLILTGLERVSLVENPQSEKK